MIAYVLAVKFLYEAVDLECIFNFYYKKNSTTKNILDSICI